MAKKIIFEVELKGASVVLDSQQAIAAAQKAINEELKKAKFGTAEFDKLATAMAQTKAAQKAATDEVKSFARAVESTSGAKGSYRQLNAQLVELRATFKDLSAAERNGQLGATIGKQIGVLDTQLKSIDADIGLFQRNVGNYGSAFADLGATLAGGLGIAFGADAIASGIGQLHELTGEFRNLRDEIADFSGASGEALDNLTTKSKGLAVTFGKTTEEINAAANTIAKNLTGGDFDAAFAAIETGFLHDADAGGQFLDIVKQYSPVFKDAGLSADQLVTVVSKQVKDGVFSEKGIEAISKASKNLRLLGPEVQKSLEGIGLSGEEIRKQIADEGVGAAIATVAAQLEKLPATSAPVAEVIGKIFGKSASEAGISTITGLKDLAVNAGLAGEALDELATLQAEQLSVNEKFAAVQNEVAKALGATDGSIGTVGTQLKTVLLEAVLKVITGLITFVNIIRGIPQFLEENRVGLSLLAGGLVALNIQQILAAANALRLAAVQKIQTIVTAATTLAQRGLNAAMDANPVGLLVTAIGLLITFLGAAYQKSQTFRAGIDGLGAVIVEFVNIFKEGFGGLVSGFSSLLDGDFKGAFEGFKKAAVTLNPIALFTTQGKRLGEAYKKGYAESIEKSEAAKAAEALLPGPETIKAADDKGKEVGYAVAKGFAAGSISALQKAVGDLKKAIDEAPDAADSNLFEKLISAEAELKKAEQFRDDLLKSLNPEKAAIQKIEIQRSQQIISTVVKTGGGTDTGLGGSEKAAAEERKRINAQADADILAVKIRYAQQGSEERAKLEADLAVKLLEIGLAGEKLSLDGKVDSLNRQRNAALLAAAQSITDEKELAEKRKAINLAADLAILEARRDAAPAGSDEALAFEREIADKRVDAVQVAADEEVKINQKKLDEIQKQEEEAAALRDKIREAGIESAQTALDLIAEGNDIFKNNQLKALEEQFAREIELAGDNEEKKEELAAELEKKKLAIEKQAFDRKKKTDIAAVLIDGARAFVKALAELGPIAGPLFAAFIAAATATKVAFIGAQKFERGGRVSGLQFGQQIGYRTGGLIRGRSHAEGGIPIEVEGGEFLTRDEFGQPVVINKRSAAAFGGQLSAIHDLNFAGKGDYLSGINSYRNFGRAFADGGIIPAGAALIPGGAGVQASAPVAGQVIARLSPDDIEFLARMMGRSVQSGAETGIVAGIGDTNRRAEREARLKEKTATN